MEYSELSSHQRDVVQVLLRADSSLSGKSVKVHASRVRSESETAYTYEVLTQLKRDGWVTERPDRLDDRVYQYALTSEARRAISAWFDALGEVGPVDIGNRGDVEQTAVGGLSDALLEASPDAV